MFRNILATVAFVALTTLSLMGFQSNDPEPDEVVVSCGEICDNKFVSGYPVELVFAQNTGQVILRVRFDRDYRGNYLYSKEKALKALATAVVQLIEQARERAVSLENGKVHFRYQDGHPLWVPYVSYKAAGDMHYQGLVFAHAKMHNGKIVAKGAGEPPYHKYNFENN